MVLFIEYYQDDKIKKDKMGRVRSTCGDIRNAYKILIGNPKEKSPLGRTKSRWNDNIKMDFIETW
jgi:hypothetical protein